MFSLSMCPVLPGGSYLFTELIPEILYGLLPNTSRTTEVARREGKDSFREDLRNICAFDKEYTFVTKDKCVSFQCYEVDRKIYHAF
jgi:hypothetical protein